MCVAIDIFKDMLQEEHAVGNTAMNTGSSTPLINVTKNILQFMFQKHLVKRNKRKSKDDKSVGTRCYQCNDVSSFY